ncbi:sugar transferase [Patescibacteria group bacterium]|nr:sugar transferase [Patescibacteria group bacterium]MBU4367801.1 sugar transferase [Patescibacteria group bacterium]MBU4461503.1 sugar transferase [Patescibacteria group bacterium]MCG2699959.1 sugar transferase [Candidatus Parcubacteria bacterium]
MKENKPIQKSIKKNIDFLVSFFGLILLSPFFVFTAVLIKLDSKGPVFFKQKRVGRDGKVFIIWKFRTMIENAEKIETKHEISKDDFRITKIGKFLRSWTLDEFPQLINVLIGEMSLVGPRPLPEYHVEKYNDFQKKVLTIKPGMVSLVDIKGRALVPWEKRFEYDVWYIKNWSLRLDFKILFLIIGVILSRKGVYGKD